MDVFPLFYIPDRPARISSAFQVHAMGIRERMPPSCVRRDAPVMPWLIMHFHDEASLRPGTDSAQAAAGGTVIWEPNVRHHYGNDHQEWVHSWCIADGSLLASTVRAARLPVNTLLRAGDAPLHDHYMRALYNELHRHSPPDPYIVEGLVQMWLREMARAHRAASGPTAPPEMSAVREHIEANLQRRLTVAHLARVANLSRYHFCHRFKDCFGTAPLQYVNELRMKRAALLLIDNSLPIQRIAHLCGFEDPLYFSKRFRRRWGQGPRAYRAARV